MNPIRYEKDASNVVTLTFDQPGSPVNTMNAEWREAFAQAVDRVEAERESIAGVVLASAKTSFFAGADLKSVLELNDSDAPRLFQEIERVKRAFRALDRLGRPVVAAINGAALGGGWEVALAAHHRVCVDDAKIQIGLPEVTLGLIPGASGITKMVRLLGLEAAMPYLMEGKLFSPREAAKLGLVHQLAGSSDELMAAARAWIAANPAPKQPWDEEKYRLPGGGASNPKIAQMLAIAPAMLVAKTRHLYPAPEAIMACAAEGAAVDFDTALRIESRHLARIMVGQVAKNMITAFFFDLNAVKSAKTKGNDGAASDAFARRLVEAYATEGRAMLTEHIPAAVIENAGLQAGMRAGPLAAAGATEQPRADRETHGKTWDMDELKDRFLYRQALEAARCLEEGVIAGVAEANVGSILDSGFPAWTGGALQFMNSVGPAAFVARAGQLAARHGPRFAPPEIVRKKAACAEFFV